MSEPLATITGLYAVQRLIVELQACSLNLKNHWSEKPSEERVKRGREAVILARVPPWFTFSVNTLLLRLRAISTPPRPQTLLARIKLMSEPSAAS